MATVGVSFGCRGGTMRGFGGGVELRRSGSRVAFGNTAARVGDDAGAASSPLGEVRRAGGRNESRAFVARGCEAWSAVFGADWAGAGESAAAELASLVTLPVKGYLDGDVPDGNVGGGRDERLTLGNAIPGGSDRGSSGGGGTCCAGRPATSAARPISACEV